MLFPTAPQIHSNDMSASPEQFDCTYKQVHTTRMRLVKKISILSMLFLGLAISHHIWRPLIAPKQPPISIDFHLLQDLEEWINPDNKDSIQDKHNAADDSLGSFEALCNKYDALCRRITRDNYIDPNSSYRHLLMLLGALAHMDTIFPSPVLSSLLEKVTIHNNLQSSR
jgi:hypothetical protein